MLFILPLPLCCSAKLEFLTTPVETYITVPNGDIAVPVCSTNQEIVGSGVYGSVTVSWMRNGEPLDITGSSAYSYLNGVFTVKDYSAFDVHSTNFTCNVQWSSTFTEKPVEATRSFSISMDGEYVCVCVCVCVCVRACVRVCVRVCLNCTFSLTSLQLLLNCSVVQDT